jgi:hypothetical protein
MEATTDKGIGSLLVCAHKSMAFQNLKSHGISIHSIHFNPIPIPILPSLFPHPVIIKESARNLLLVVMSPHPLTHQLTLTPVVLRKIAAKMGGCGESEERANGESNGIKRSPPPSTANPPILT